MRANWFKGIIILAILSLLWALFTAPNRSKSMGEDIRGSLAAAGFTDTQVDMNGNVATLTGEAASEATRNEIGRVAAETKCSKCADKKTWHEVKNDIAVKTAPPVPTQSPYTFSAIKSEDGSVMLNGWVQNQEQLDRVLAKAKATFGNVIDRKVRIANGAPNDGWEGAMTQNMDSLSLLDYGRFSMKDSDTEISGATMSVDARDGVVAKTANIAGFNNTANVKLLTPTTGEITSIEVCQTLLDDLKRGKKINFAYDKAEIRGAESFDLLNSLASAANQCASFKINIEGHTDSDGANSYNQRLSEARANLVVAYLSENGVERSRMRAIGYGETKPIADNATDAGKAQNRRIEFIVTESE